RPLHLPSFPTRRSSDLGSGPLQTLFAVGSGRVDYSAPGLPNLSARIYRSTDAGANWSASENGLPLPIDIVPGPDVGLSYNIAITDRKSTRLNSSHVKIS